ncbi:hypothetical protein [Streptomyces xantholiticus]|uniref:Uncharacterized protein n=1 Tax=Streptomyces xantholiticus TaxID=68285 RepID=A0ABV1V157_9ACTN
MSTDNRLWIIVVVLLPPASTLGSHPVSIQSMTCTALTPPPFVRPAMW